MKTKKNNSKKTLFTNSFSFFFRLTRVLYLFRRSVIAEKHGFAAEQNQRAEVLTKKPILIRRTRQYRVWRENWFVFTLVVVKMISRSRKKIYSDFAEFFLRVYKQVHTHTQQVIISSDPGERHRNIVRRGLLFLRIRRNVRSDTWRSCRVDHTFLCFGTHSYVGNYRESSESSSGHKVCVAAKVGGRP